MALVRIYLCGRLAVESGDHVLTERALPARQGRRLWTYLVLNRRRPISRDDLAGAIWGDEIPDAWDGALTTLVSRVRSAIAALDGSVAIHGEPGRYSLSAPSDAVVDLERARAALHAAETAVRRGAWGEALAEARVAMEIAARGFLSGEELPWIEGQRRGLADLRMHALEATVAADIGRGRSDLAAREAELLLSLDPLREEGYRLLMRAVAADGDTLRLARVMDACRRTLALQVDAHPSAETERLYVVLNGTRSI